MSHPVATPDSDCARRPLLADSSANEHELRFGDRVIGLGDFGKPTGEFDIVQRANEDDAEVRWVPDRRVRVHQPSISKALPGPRFDSCMIFEAERSTEQSCELWQRPRSIPTGGCSQVITLKTLFVGVHECFFYEKVVKVMADAAALLIFLAFVVFATFPQKILR